TRPPSEIALTTNCTSRPSGARRVVRMTRCLRQQESSNVMKRIIAVAAVAVSLGAGAFVSGPWWADRFGAAHASAHAATVYICPMHPDYDSDHPDHCPVCGMPLTAHGAREATGGAAAARALPHGAVQVNPERQQAIGIRLGVVT